jgi:deoxyribonuclease-4
MQIGCCANINNLLMVADYAKQNDAKIVQVVLRNKFAYRSSRNIKNDLLLLKNKLDNYKINVVVHSSFVLNFCHPIKSYIHESSKSLLCEDMVDSIVLGALGVIVHMGHNTGRLKLTNEQAEKNYIAGLKSVLSQTPKESIIILETGAGQGSEICTSVSELGRLYNKFSEKERKRIKICIDTCHVFVTGHDISKLEYIDEFAELVDQHIGFGNISCIHLNDSEKCLGSRIDRHADVGRGEIGLDALIKIIKIFKDFPIVLETPCKEEFTHQQQIKLIRKIINNN